MPFTVEQFFDAFIRYNEGVWPAQLVLNALALLVLALLARGGSARGRWVAAILALLWSWTAVAYHFAYFTAINPAAWLFGAVSLSGGLWFAWVGVVKRRLQFSIGGGARSWLGGALVLFALLVYPLLGYLLGHRFPAAPTFGLPCPTTIFTMGVLLFGVRPVPRSIFVVPVLWAAVGSTAAFQLGVYQDLGLLVAAGAGLLEMLRPAHLGRASLQPRDGRG